VRRRQCVISAAAAGSSAAAMFPLFITHDEYFVRCGGSGHTPETLYCQFKLIAINCNFN
jgi:hypothetical protein